MKDFYVFTVFKLFYCLNQSIPLSKLKLVFFHVISNELGPLPEQKGFRL